MQASQRLTGGGLLLAYGAPQRSRGVKGCLHQVGGPRGGGIRTQSLSGGTGERACLQTGQEACVPGNWEALCGKANEAPGTAARPAHAAGWHGSQHVSTARQPRVSREREWSPQVLGQAFRGRVCRTLCPAQRVAGGQPKHEQPREWRQSPPTERGHVNLASGW